MLHCKIIIKKTLLSFFAYKIAALNFYRVKVYIYLLNFKNKFIYDSHIDAILLSLGF